MSISKVSNGKIALAYLCWWLVLVVVETYALHTTFSFTWVMAFADAVNLNLLIATAGYIMHNSLRYYQPSPKNAVSMLVWSLALTTGCVLLHRLLMTKYLFPDDTFYLTYLSNSNLIRGIITWMMIAIMAILSWVWFYYQDQHASEKRDLDVAKLAREAELASLRQQLQPHFLFNSLNSISALAGSKPEAARKMIQQLSDFLRGTIKRDDQHLVTLSEELTHLNLYLEIEKVRFGHRLNTVIEHDEACTTLQLPSLLLQPIVENAIKFGLYDTIGEITIRLQAKKENQELVIMVENPFDAATAQPKQGTGFGLNGIRRRLYLLYARNNLLTTHQKENQTFITEVRIPQKA